MNHRGGSRGARLGARDTERATIERVRKALALSNYLRPGTTLRRRGGEFNHFGHRDQRLSELRYDVVLLGSPIWNVRTPMIMSTFVEGVDFTGKAIFPFTTHAMSGRGNDRARLRPLVPRATIAEGIAVRGEQVRNAGAAVEDWVRRSALPRR